MIASLSNIFSTFSLLGYATSLKKDGLEDSRSEMVLIEKDFLLA